MKKFVMLPIVIFIAAISQNVSAQEATDPTDKPFTKEWVTAMFNGIQLKDISTTEHKWGYSFVSDDKEKISKLAGALTTKADGAVRLGNAEGKYICSIEDNKAFTAQSLYDRITYLNETAKSLGVEPMRTFGLMKEDK